MDLSRHCFPRLKKKRRDDYINLLSHCEFLQETTPCWDRDSGGRRQGILPIPLPPQLCTLCILDQVLSKHKGQRQSALRPDWPWFRASPRTGRILPKPQKLLGILAFNFSRSLCEDSEFGSLPSHSYLMGDSGHFLHGQGLLQCGLCMAQGWDQRGWWRPGPPLGSRQLSPQHHSASLPWVIKSFSLCIQIAPLVGRAVVRPWVAIEADHAVWLLVDVCSKDCKTQRAGAHSPHLTWCLWRLTQYLVHSRCFTNDCCLSECVNHPS